MSRRVRVIVTGRVQGVAYRAATAFEARRLGVVGWVRNLPDGSVELEVEGAEAQIATMLGWCEVGPPAARVTAVTVSERVPLGTEHELVIRS
jgi:acylphosphatase